MVPSGSGSRGKAPKVLRASLLSVSLGTAETRTEDLLDTEQLLTGCITLLAYSGKLRNSGKDDQYLMCGSNFEGVSNTTKQNFLEGAAGLFQLTEIVFSLNPCILKLLAELHNGWAANGNALLMKQAGAQLQALRQQLSRKGPIAAGLLPAQLR